jgi:hypothetical protein
VARNKAELIARVGSRIFPCMENYRLMRTSQIFIAPPGLHLCGGDSHYFIYYSISRFNVLAQRLRAPLAQQLLFYSVSAPTIFCAANIFAQKPAAVSHISAKRLDYL